MEECLEPLVPIRKCETVLRRDPDPSELLQLGTVGESGGQMNKAEAWQVFSLVMVGLFLVSAALTTRSSLRL